MTILMLSIDDFDGADDSNDFDDSVGDKIVFTDNVNDDGKGL